MKLGILQLDTPFERLPGDAGHAATWPFPVQLHIMHGVTPDAVMQGDKEVLRRIMEGVQELLESGVTAITTTCGFLVLQQAEIAARCPVPFISSSLLQIPMLLGLLPADKTVGVIASQAEALTAAHWRAAGLSLGTEQRLHVVGFAPESHFIRSMRGQDKPLDPKRLAQEVVAVAQQLVQQHPDVAAIVSECANLPRYSALLRQQTQRAVLDVRTLVLWQVSGLLRYATMHNNLPDNFPKTKADWQGVIDCAPGSDRALTSMEMENAKNAVVVHVGGIAAIRQALAERKKSEQWVTLRLDQEIWARWRASGVDWQSRIVQVLTDNAP